MSASYFPTACLAIFCTFSIALGFDDDRIKEAATDSSSNSSSKTEVAAGRASAVFAGGCFWCVESDFEKAPGVVEIVAGYSGGRLKNPTYKNYASGGHREAVFVVYDPTKVTYAGLVEYLLKHVDPTDRTGSFIDKGLQYTSAIYYATPEEKSEAQRVVKAIDEMKVLRGRVTVPILPRQAFWPAEEYHQDYHSNNVVKYGNYRATCGRDNFVQKLWGPAANQLAIPGAYPEASQISKVQQEAADVEKPQSTALPASKDKGKELSAWMKFTKPSDRELRKKLSAVQFEVTQRHGTEIAFRNPFWNNHDEGLYVDVVSGEPLFASTDKFDSGTGWPSFAKPVDPRLITSNEDRSEVPVRIEVRSRIGDSHLGHIFNDGPVERGGLRYCINSASLRFVPKRKLESEGYGQFLELFEGVPSVKKPH